MTKQEAKRYVGSNDDESASEPDVSEAFTAIFGREPDAQDRQEGLWSHLCAAV